MAADDDNARDHYREAADGLEEAAKALRACASDGDSDDDDGETPREKQPKDLRGAAQETKRRFAQSRKPEAQSGKPDKSDEADQGNKPLPSHT